MKIGDSGDNMLVEVVNNDDGGGDGNNSDGAGSGSIGNGMEGGNGGGTHDDIDDNGTEGSGVILTLMEAIRRY